WLGHAVGVLESCNDALDCEAPHLGLLLGHGGQARSSPGRRRDVVQADDADVFRDAPPRVSQATQGTDGRQVVVAIDRGDAWMVGDQLARAAIPALEVRL